MTDPTVKVERKRPSGMQRAVATAKEHYSGNWSRVIEDLMFAGGAGNAVFRATGENVIWLVREIGVLKTPHVDHGVAWGFYLLCFVGVLPKIVSRATYSDVIKSLTGAAGKLISRGRPAAPGEKEE